LAFCDLESESGIHYFQLMSTKELAMETIKDLPEDASWQEIEERIRFLAAIEKAREEVRGGAVMLHEDVRNLLNGWLSE
jgi:hypothetical protein